MSLNLPRFQYCRKAIFFKAQPGPAAHTASSMGSRQTNHTEMDLATQSKNSIQLRNLHRPSSESIQARHSAMQDDCDKDSSQCYMQEKSKSGRLASDAKSQPRPTARHIQGHHALALDAHPEIHLEALHSGRDRRASSQRRQSGYWERPGDYVGLDEVALPMPIDDPEETSRSDYLEDNRRRLSRTCNASDAAISPPSTTHIRRVLNEAQVLSYLVFFSMLGTLARLALDRLTRYTNAPIQFEVLWSNLTGTFILGFLLEISQIHMTENGRARDESGPETTDSEEQGLDATKKTEIRKTPWYIGLSTGFCGSMTSYSSFTRDALLGLTNALSTGSLPAARTAGMDIMAMLGVMITTVTVCLGALKLGAHFAIFASHSGNCVKYQSHIAMFSRLRDFGVYAASLGGWISLLVLTITSRIGVQSSWYTSLLASLLLAPPGCILRFYISIMANPISTAFPFGTFAVNMIGTAILGMAWDIQHTRVNLVSCQLLEGIMDGFCGCLTTVSTWIAELSSLHRKHSYVYGAITLSLGLILLIAIMGSLKWSLGWQEPVCMTSW